APRSGGPARCASPRAAGRDSPRPAEVRGAARRIGLARMGAGTGAIVPVVGPLGVVVPGVWLEVVFSSVRLDVVVPRVPIPGIGPRGVIIPVVRLLVITGGVARAGVLGPARGVLMGRGGPPGILVGASGPPGILLRARGLSGVLIGASGPAGILLRTRGPPG